MLDYVVGIEAASFVPYAIIIPVSIYGIIRFHLKAKTQIFATKQSLFLTWGLNISLLCAILSSAYFHAFLLYIDDLDNPNGAISVLFYMLCWFSILYFLIMRAWLLHFKHRFHAVSLQLQWQQLINSNAVETSHNTNWYIRNHHKYGNAKYITKRSAPLAIFTYLWFILYFVYPLKPFMGIGFILTMSFIIFYIIILCKTRYQSDTYFIHWECKMHSRLLSICVMIEMIIASIQKIAPMNSNGRIIGISLFYPFISAIFCVMILISTIIMIKKNTTNVTIRHKMAPEKDTKEIYTVELLLSNEQSINAFMKWLARELSLKALCLFYSDLCISSVFENM